MPTTIADAVLIGITALGLNAGDKVELNASIYQINRPMTFVHRFQAPRGNTNAINKLATVAGDPSGTTDYRMQRQIVSSEGPADFVDLRNRYAGTNHNGTGRVNRTYTDHLYLSVTGGGSTGPATILYAHGLVANDSFVEDMRVFEAGDLFLTNGGRVNNSVGLRVDNIGHPTNAKFAYGVQVANFDASHAVAGVEVSTTARLSTMNAMKHAFSAIGDAPSRFAGKVRFGSTAQPQYPVDVLGDAQVTGLYRFANGVTMGSGPGMPSYPAAKGSLYLSTDYGLVQNTDGNMGWNRR